MRIQHWIRNLTTFGVLLAVVVSAILWAQWKLGNKENPPDNLASSGVVVKGADKREIDKEGNLPDRIGVAENMPLFPFFENGKWGYIDTEGRVAILPRFSWAGDFHEGRAHVTLQNSRGWINTRGNIVFDLPHDNERDFSNGLCAFERSGKWGYVDAFGKVVIDPQFDDVRDFSGGLAAVNVGAGMVTERMFGSFVVNGKWGTIDKTGRFVTPPRFSSAESLFPERLWSEGLKPVVHNKKWGYIDRSDKVVIDFQYAEAGRFSEGLARVLMTHFGNMRERESWGYINRRGEFVIPAGIRPDGLAPFNDAKDFRGGLAHIHLGGTWALWTDIGYDWIGGDWYYINREGKTVSRICGDKEYSNHGRWTWND